MRRLIVFNNISLDGYFVDAGGDMRWAHSGGKDPEFEAFAAGNASGDSELVFGRKTYEVMAGYWPTPAARAAMPDVAENMNRKRKVVFSRSLTRADWANTRLVNTDPAAAIRRMKAANGPGLVILGSGTIVAQAAAAVLVDEFQFVVIPIVLGGGRTLFEGLGGPCRLSLEESRKFASGKVFLRYRPA